MAANIRAGKFPVDSKELDAEFQKFMDEPLSDDSHRTSSPMYHQIRNKLEQPSTQDSFERALADEFSTTVTASDSLSPIKQKSDVNEYMEEHLSGKDNEIEDAASKNEGLSFQNQSHAAEAADYSATMRTSKDDTLRDSRVIPAHSFDGMDTLEELADKERFFSNLAADVSGTLDFAKLNRALDEIQSDHEKSDDPVTVLSSKNVPEKDNAAFSEVVKTDQNAEMEENGHEIEEDKVGLGQSDHQSMIKGRFEEEFDLGVGHASSDKEVHVAAKNEWQQSKVTDYDSDTPRSDSLRSIKEVAKAKIKEAKERSKEKGRNIANEKVSGSKEKNSSLSRLPRPLEESRRKSTSAKSVRKRRSSSHRSASSNSTYKDSAGSDSSAKSSKHNFKQHQGINSVEETHFHSLEKLYANKVSSAERISKSNPSYSNERELPAENMKVVSRELQLQNELYELRSDYYKVMRENERFSKELERVSKLHNERDMRLKYEFELDQLQQKNVALESQLKKAKELRIRSESDEDKSGKDVSNETLQLRKELQEQELLLNGYQLENERLFREMKRKDSERRQLQSTLAEENQRLKSSLAESEKIRENLDMKLKELRKEKETWDHFKRNTNCDLEANENMKRLVAENNSLQQEIGFVKEHLDSNEKIVKDLERQKKEMEAIIKKRYPDTVPSLLVGQENMPKLDGKKSASLLTEDKSVQVNMVKDPIYGSKHVEFLERTTRRLEKELDAKDEETSRLLAAAQQRCNKMAIVYEKQIDGLQEKLDIAIEKQKSLEDKRAAVINNYSKRSTAPYDEVGEAMEAHESSFRNAKRHSKKVSEEREKSSRTGIIESEFRRPGIERALSPIFAASEDSHLSKLQKENIDLTLKLHGLQADYKELRVKSTAELAKSKADCDIIRSNSDAEIMKMKQIHTREVEMAKESYVKYEQNILKLQDENQNLMKKVSDYDFVAEKLKERKLEAAVDKELLQAAKLKEEVLHNQVKMLQKQLKDAFDCQPPPQQRINHIEMQLSAIQKRQIDREDELQQAIRTSHSKFDSRVSPYGVDWGKIVEAKDAQIKQFREELDEILHTLHSLYASSSFLYRENVNILPYPHAR